MGKSRKIFVVDDHPIMRLGYKYLLNREDQLEVCGEASSVAEALSGIATHRPHLVIADISLDGASGIELVKQLHSENPEIHVVVVSMHDEALFAERALRAGARAYLMKNEVESRLVHAIQTVLDGGFYLSQRMNSQILSGFARGDSLTATSSLGRLTDRELQVFEMQGRGKSTREIGDAMHISPKTVETYRRRIKQKLSLDSTAALTHRAVEWLQSEKRGGESGN
ncbi:MAG: response regulator transcription factor [Rhodothermales bacterium]|nr:response regulator transcription factor [Rhodothermales bacterium]